MGSATADLPVVARDRRSNERTPDYHPSDEDERIVSSILDKHQEQKSYKRPYEKTWFVNHAAVVGQHYLIWNDVTQAFTVPARPPSYRVRMAIPYMMAYWRRTCARLTSHRPGLHVTPATTDEQDIERARVNLYSLEGEFERLAFQKSLKEATGWAIETGNVLWGLRWNPQAGPELTEEQPVMTLDPMTGMEIPQADPTSGEPVMETVPVLDDFGRPLHEGAIELEVVNPYEFEFDPEGTGFDNGGWCKRNSVKSLDWIRANYPEMGQYVKGEDVYLNSIYEKRHKQLVGAYGYTTAGKSGEEKDLVKNAAVVHEYWERPTPGHPDGRLIVIAGKVLLFKGPNPYKKLLQMGFWAPYIHWGEIRVTGRFWFQAVIEHIFPLNKILNRARSQEEENRTIHGRPKILVPRTAKIRQGSFDAEAGEKVDYTPGPNGAKPEIMYPQSTAVATQTSIAHTINDIQEGASWHEVSRGILPSANVPGVAVDKLQQADETALGETEGHMRDAIISLGRMILGLASQFWTEERLVRVTGEGGRIIAQRIKGEEMSGTSANVDYFDVRMIPQSTMWKDPEAQRKQVEYLIGLRVLDPIRDRALILKMLDQASIQEAFKDDQLDTQHSCHENELMEQGVMTEARDFENHEIHILEHNRYRKGERYRRLPPELQMLFDQHVEMHKQLRVAVAQQEAMAQVAVQSVAAPPGEEEGATPDSEEGTPSPGG